MTTPNLTSDRPAAAPQANGRGGARGRRPTPPQHGGKSPPLLGVVGGKVGRRVCAPAQQGGDNGTDEFIARNAWLYVAIVAGAYMISRGLAKAGSRDPYTDDSRQDSNR